MTEKVHEIIKRWEKLSGDKSQWHSLWDDLARVMLPRRIGFATTTVDGERRTDDIFDGTPLQAARGLANAIGGMMRPSGIPEVEMRAEEDDLNNLSEVQDWLADSEERLKNAFNNPKAKFRDASGEKDLDLVVLGTAVMFNGESQKRNHLLFRSLHLKDCTPAFDEEGNPDTMFYKRRMTIRQAAERFGEDKLSESTREKFKKTPDDKIDVLRVVMPRKDAKFNAFFARNLPFTDIWLEIDAKHEIEVGGFHEFPYIVPRWDTSSGEDFGRSPGMIALPDADTLQAMGETILIAGQRAADPPLAVPNDGAFDAINTFPGGLSYYDIESAIAVKGNPFFSIQSATNLPISRDMQADTRQQIWAAFFRNVLNLPIGGPQMTAFEVNQRKEEMIREIGPVFGRLESGDTVPTVERSFMVMLRNGGFAPIPEVLQGRNVVFVYDSPTKRIRKQIEAATARMWALEMLQLGEVKPEAIDLVNVDELGRFSAEALGIHRSIVNSEETVEQIRQVRAEAMEAQQMAAGAQAAMDIAKTGAEAADKAGMVERPEKARPTQRAA